MSRCECKVPCKWYTTVGCQGCWCCGACGRDGGCDGKHGVADLQSSKFSYNEEVEWQNALLKAEEQYDDMLTLRFGPGTYGFHELVDRIHVACATWEDHIATHPSVALDKERHKKAWDVLNQMTEFYQMCGVADWPEEKKKEETNG